MSLIQSACAPLPEDQQLTPGRGIRRFITVCTATRHCSVFITSIIKSISLNPTYLTYSLSLCHLCLGLWNGTFLTHFFRLKIYILCISPFQMRSSCFSRLILEYPEVKKAVLRIKAVFCDVATYSLRFVFDRRFRIAYCPPLKCYVRQCDPLKRRSFSKWLHGAKLQKTSVFLFSGMDEVLLP
jgi:hypothetical protein